MKKKSNLSSKYLIRKEFLIRLHSKYFVCVQFINNLLLSL